MLILRVDLENIKSYERATIEFAPGVNAIMGHNGAGKSTILEAIGYALFDALPYDTGAFVREGAKTGRVAVTFVGKEDERPYRVERRVGGSHQYVVYDVELGAKLCEGKTDVLAFVRRQVGSDAGVNLTNVFNNAVGVPQGALTAAFALTASQRKGVFDPLLQVDDYKTASDKLLEPRNVLQDRVRTVAQEVAVLAARLERLPELEKAVRQRTAELSAIEQSLVTLCARLEQIEAAKAEWDAIRRQIDEGELQRTRQVQRCAALEAQAGESRRQLAEAEGAARELAANQEGHDQYVAAQARKEELDRQVHARQNLREQHARADKQLALAQSDLAAIEERLAAVAAAEELISRLAPAVRQQDQLEAALADLQKERGGLQEAARNRAAQQDELQKLHTRAERLAAQLAEAEGVQQAAQQVEQAIADLRRQSADLTGEQGAVQAAANELKRQNETLESVATALCPVCEQPLSAQHRSEMLARNGARLQELRSTFGSNQKRLKQAEATLQEAEAKHKQHNAALRSLPRADELEDLRGRIEQLTAAVAAGAAAETALAGIEGRFAALNRDLAALQNPRQQSAVAMQQAGERPQLLARQGVAAGQRQAATDQLAALEAALKPLAGLDDSLAEVNGTLRRSQAAYQVVLSNRKLAESAPQRAAAVAQVAAALEEGQAALAEIERALLAVKAQFDPVAYASISSEDQSLRSELGGQQARQTLLRAEQGRDQAELRVLQGQQAELAALSAEQVKLNRRAAVLDAVRTLLRQSGPYVTQALIRQISAGATRIFGELMQDYSRELQWQEDYGIVLKVEGATRQFAQLSGGEQMSAALAVRLALVREISNIDIAFFDEPTANLDDVRREALAQQIMNVKGFRQLFVISHDDTFEQVTQNLVRVKRHGSSSIVAPSES